ncbi:MAG: hypothetical protein MK102_00615 [Fuerstiella sp.]|nr:hypothetical protein [Fuerstiella sp.]
MDSDERYSLSQTRSNEIRSCLLFWITEVRRFGIGTFADIGSKTWLQMITAIAMMI